MILLGTITVASGAAQNNTTTAVPFKIPPWVKAVYLESDTDLVKWAMFAGASADSSQAAANTGSTIPASGTPIGPFPTGGVADAPTVVMGNTLPPGATGATVGGVSKNAPVMPSTVLSVFNPTAGGCNVKVFAQPSRE